MDRQRREAHRFLSELLDREWDPIGVYGHAAGLRSEELVDGGWREVRGPWPPDAQAPPGEYETYAGWILRELQSGAGADGVVACMSRARVRMGLGARPEADTRVALRIMDWWREAQPRA